MDTGICDKGYIIPVDDKLTLEMKDDIVPAALDILNTKIVSMVSHVQ